MRHFVLAAVLAFAASAAAADTITKEAIPFAGTERTYYLDVPDTARGTAPLLVLLHGSGGSGAFMLDRWKQTAAREGIVLLAPDSLHTQVGWELRNDGPDYIHALVQAVEAKHPVDTHRVYAFGQSGGAVYALTLAMLESEYFAAVAFHAGGWRKPEEHRALSYATRKIPIGMWVGDRDEYFSMASQRETVNALIAAGFPAELSVLEGRKHAYSDVPDDFHDTVWAFLKGHALDGPPRYAEYGKKADD
jgi:poly(3-hydroxybutyrate) depolymerase